MKYIPILFIFFFFFAACNHEPLNNNILSSTPVNDTLSIVDSANNSITKDVVIPADSITKAYVTLSVDANTYAKYRQVVLTISPVGKFSNDSPIITLQIDNTHHAYTYISSSQIGRAYITATVGNALTTDSVLFTAPGTNVALSVGTYSVTADNYSYTTITATITPPNILYQVKTILFTTNKGTFSNNMDTCSASFFVNAAGSIMATAYLKDNKVEQATISASVPNTNISSRDTFIYFTTAYPYIIAVNPDSVILKDSFSVHTNIVTQFKRLAGIVSAGQIVTFYDSLSTDTVKGINLINYTAIIDSTEMSTIRYTITDTSGLAHGAYLYIIGVVDTGSSQVRGLSRIYLQ